MCSCEDSQAGPGERKYRPGKHAVEIQKTGNSVLGKRLKVEPEVTKRFPVAMAKGSHLFPFRTQKLSPSAPMVLGWTRPGRVGRRRNLFLSSSMAEHSAVNRRVVGSSPTWGAIKKPLKPPMVSAVSFLAQGLLLGLKGAVFGFFVPNLFR